MTKTKKPRSLYWTPERIAALVEASGLATQAEFATKAARVSPSLLSAWITGVSVPSPHSELVLDKLAAEFDEPHSERNH